MVYTAGKHTKHTVGGAFDYYSVRFFMTTHSYLALVTKRRKDIYDLQNTSRFVNHVCFIESGSNYIVSLLKIVTCPFYQNYQYVLIVTAWLQKLKNIPGFAQYI